MYLSRLQLARFRNYTHVDLALQPGCVLLLGQNGQGKTNLLEAVAYLSQGRSFRTSTDAELVSVTAEAGEPNSSGNAPEIDYSEAFGPFARVALTLKKASLSYEATELEARLIGQQVTAGSRALHEGWRFKVQFRKNQKALKSRTALLGELPSVSFVLADLLLLRGGPADRRRWLDAAASQLEPALLGHLQQYQRVLKQKSQWLKRYQEALLGGQYQSGADVLETFNEQLARLSAVIVQARCRFLATIETSLANYYAHLAAGEDPPVVLGYQFGSETLRERLPEAVPALLAYEEEALYLAYRERLHELQRAELARGQCLLGPHRDDVLLGLGTLAWSASRYASQGQQRSLVLAAKLAELDALALHYEEAPILLLDDVMAELDLRRQRLLLDKIGQSHQVFLTTTHLEQEVLRPLLSGEKALPHQILQVRAGTVTPYTEAAVTTVG